MFKLKQKPSYWWPVTFQQPDDGGKVVEQTIEVEYHRFDEDEHEALCKESAEQRMGDRAFARRVVRCVRNVVDEAGQPLPFNSDTFTELLKVPGLATAIVREYFASRVQAAEKN